MPGILSGPMSNTPTPPVPPANAAISIRITVATSKWLGVTSLGSGKQIAAGDQVVMCPKCFKPVLLEDWRTNGSKCPEDSTPGRVIERASRATGASDNAPAAAAQAAPAASAVVPTPGGSAPQVRSTVAAVPPPSVTTAIRGPAPATIEVDPYRNARNVEAPPVSDVWRRNIMTIFWMLMVWGIIVMVVWVLGLDPTALRRV